MRKIKIFGFICFLIGLAFILVSVTSTKKEKEPSNTVSEKLMELYIELGEVTTVQRQKREKKDAFNQMILRVDKELEPINEREEELKKQISELQFNGLNYMSEGLQ